MRKARVVTKLQGWLIRQGRITARKGLQCPEGLKWDAACYGYRIFARSEWWWIPDGRHPCLTAKAVDLKLSLGLFYWVHLTNLLLAQLPQARKLEDKNWIEDSTKMFNLLKPLVWQALVHVTLPHWNFVNWIMTTNSDQALRTALAHNCVKPLQLMAFAQSGSGLAIRRERKISPVCKNKVNVCLSSMVINF